MFVGLSVKTDGEVVFLAQPPGDVHGLELVEASEHAGTGHASQDVGAGSLHHGHEALVLEDLHAAVDGALVLDAAAGGHHHAPSDGVYTETEVIYTAGS